MRNAWNLHLFSGSENSALCSLGNRGLRKSLKQTTKSSPTRRRAQAALCRRQF